jgi:hypothetical protein
MWVFQQYSGKPPMLDPSFRVFPVEQFVFQSVMGITVTMMM